MKSLAYLLLSAMVLMSCSNEKKDNALQKGIKKAAWGSSDNKEVDLYTLTNKNGVQVKISNYGGTVTSWMVPDKNGIKGNILLGFDSLSGYKTPPPYFGALIGRYGNRIAKGKFSIDGKAYQLATNDGPNHLHGGVKGFDKVVWEAATVADSVSALILTYTSKDGEEGYPGNLKVSVKYTLTDEDELTMEYNAETDKATPINLTQHNYYNLTGDASKNILDHVLILDADHYTPVDSTLIPTGEIKAVKGTPFDFTAATKIGARINSVKGGYDHNWVLNRKDSSSLQMVATLVDSASGRKLDVATTEPGIQFYSGNFLDGKLKTTDGKVIYKHDGLCLETQHFPNSPNQVTFPTTILLPRQKYHSLTKYRFSLVK